MSTYKFAIDYTTGTIDRRARYFRNLVIMVVTVGLVSIAGAVVTWEWFALAGLALLLPICGVYFFLDSEVLNEWRAKLFEGWIKGEIDFEVLRQTVAGLTTLPKDTLQSMLATLPSVGDILKEQAISSSTREAIALLSTTIDACRSDAIAVKAMGYSVGAVAFAASLVIWQWQPLLGLAAVALVPICRPLLCRWRLRRARKKTLTVRLQTNFDSEKYLEWVEALNWFPVSPRQKNEFLSIQREKPRDGEVSIV